MMYERLIVIVNHAASSDKTRYKEFEEKTGIPKSTVRAICDGRQKLNENHIQAVVSAFPQFAYWLTTGDTILQAGQISPEQESTADDYGKTGTDIE